MNNSDNTVSFLPMDRIRIVKRIEVNITSNNDCCQATVLYLRKFNENYKMLRNRSYDEKVNNCRFIYGTSEEEYPRDELDDLIIKAIKEKYQDSKVVSSLLLFPSDVDDYQRFWSLHKKSDSIIFLEPDQATLDYGMINLINGMKVPNIKLEMFLYRHINNCQLYNEFILFYDFLEWRNIGSIIDDKLDTYELLSQYLNTNK